VLPRYLPFAGTIVEKLGMMISRWLLGFVLCYYSSYLLFGTLPAVPETKLENVAPGVWFRQGEANLGYCNHIFIEMKDYFIVADANYPDGARAAMIDLQKLSHKPVRFVFDTHHHRDHAYGNLIWTQHHATTFAFRGVADEMNRYEPQRWLDTAKSRADVAALHLVDPPRPQLTFEASPFILKDETREVQFHFLGWGHTRGDGYVWLPKEKVLCTGDAVVNGPRNKLLDAYIANWPRVLGKALEFKPEHVLPGHGPAGGSELLTGQKRFLEDLYIAVLRQVRQGVTPNQTNIHLPKEDSNWVPESLASDIDATYGEIFHGVPAGALEHTWH